MPANPVSAPAALPNHSNLPQRTAGASARRDLLVALSLANLSYLRVWSELLTYRRADTYLMKATPGPAALSAVMTNVLLMAAVLWIVVSLARKHLRPSGFRWVQIAFLAFLILPANAVRAVAAQYFPYLKSPLFELLGQKGVAALGISLALAATVTILFFHRKAARIAAAALVMFAPFCAVTFGQALWKVATYRAADVSPNPPVAPFPVLANSARVVWILFDEWDYRLSFVDPGPGLHLPELQRLSRESLIATQALPPGPETPVSIPAYLTGKLVDSVRYDGPRELQIQFHGTAGEFPWSQQPSVFSHVRQLGLNTAAVEWFHPTCRILSGLTFCEWWEMPLQFNSMGRTYGTLVPGQTRSLFETTLFSAFGQSLSVRQQVETYREMLRRAIEVANNPTYAFAFIHLPVPHAPHAYDRQSGQFTLTNSPIRGYYDSLALLDRTIGEIRRAMESAGTWEKTTVLFTSDHPYREAEALDGKWDPRIPYILKTASGKEGRVYGESFNTVLTQDLVLAMLRGELTTPDKVADWLGHNRSRYQ